MSNLARRFEELEIWGNARTLNKDVYLALETCRDYSFRDQMRRAGLSVMNNIAEGFERRTSKDFAHFLDISKGSSGELRSMTYVAEDVAILTQDVAENLRQRYEALSRQIAAFQSHLRK